MFLNDKSFSTIQNVFRRKFCYLYKDIGNEIFYEK